MPTPMMLLDFVLTIALLMHQSICLEIQLLIDVSHSVQLL